jgi:deoxyribodipyrimidine photolyase-related protein
MQHKRVVLIFPHQLFRLHPALTHQNEIYLVEEDLFFNQYNFNKKKLILHRASMQWYGDYLQQKGHTIHYVNATESRADIRELIPMMGEKGIGHIHYADVTDNWLQQRLAHACVAAGITLTQCSSPYFLNKMDDVNDFFDQKRTYFQTDFYTWQRKKRNILLETNDKPIGGKWSFDTENRLKFPKNQNVPLIDPPVENKYVTEAKKWVEKYYPTNNGNILSPFGNFGGFYPTTFDEAEKWLGDFFKNRFANFGIYEDAMLGNESFINHSVLSPLLNIGLLEPQQIIDEALNAAVAYNIPLNSLEGFIRQVMGWREFIRIVYEREGSRQRTTNYWGFTRKIPATFWTGKTGIAPVDNVIRKVLATGYTHHIERLMVMGNFMQLCEFSPDDVYLWFMEMYIDAYDWVMVPNTYGMTQFADGGLMVTKPYISSSNYLLKMGDWKKGPWQTTWDGLFWHFMHKHRELFIENTRLNILVHTFDKMPKEQKNIHLKNAEIFLELLDRC